MLWHSGAGVPFSVDQGDVLLWSALHSRTDAGVVLQAGLLLDRELDVTGDRLRSCGLRESEDVVEVARSLLCAAKQHSAESESVQKAWQSMLCVQRLWEVVPELVRTVRAVIEHDIDYVPGSRQDRSQNPLVLAASSSVGLAAGAGSSSSMGDGDGDGDGGEAGTGVIPVPPGPICAMFAAAQVEHCVFVCERVMRALLYVMLVLEDKLEFVHEQHRDAVRPLFATCFPELVRVLQPLLRLTALATAVPRQAVHAPDASVRRLLGANARVTEFAGQPNGTRARRVVRRIAGLTDACACAVVLRVLAAFCLEQAPLPSLGTVMGHLLLARFTAPAIKALNFAPDNDAASVHVYSWIISCLLALEQYDLAVSFGASVGASPPASSIARAVQLAYRPGGVSSATDLHEFVSELICAMSAIREGDAVEAPLLLGISPLVLMAVQAVGETRLLDAVWPSGADERRDACDVLLQWGLGVVDGQLWTDDRLRDERSARSEDLAAELLRLLYFAAGLFPESEMVRRGARGGGVGRPARSLGVLTCAARRGVRTVDAARVHARVRARAAPVPVRASAGLRSSLPGARYAEPAVAARCAVPLSAPDVRRAVPPVVGHVHAARDAGARAAVRRRRLRGALPSCRVCVLHEPVALPRWCVRARACACARALKGVLRAQRRV
jgi:hypothetical protein